MDYGPLLGAAASRGTIGGVLAANLSGPRRIKAGAARDHFLGFRGVSGRGEIFKAGGKVVKNVTGYDLSKLMAGSYGTLAALEEVTVKVVPQPEACCTVLMVGLDPAAALRTLNRALASPHEISGAAYIPVATATLTSLAGMSGIAALRLEGPAPSVDFRRARLLSELASGGEATTIGTDASNRLWREIRDLAPLAGLGERVLWRAVAASSPARSRNASMRSGISTGEAGFCGRPLPGRRMAAPPRSAPRYAGRMAAAPVTPP
jgi:glycolate oxidase FAD binding subunit